MAVVKMPMPNYLRQMDLKVANGLDPDEIKGIERLWLWRFEMQRVEWAERERLFFAYLKSKSSSPKA